MDPFTQRMLERAKIRREKLDTLMSNAGHDVRPRKSPLRDTNTLNAPALSSSSDPTTSNCSAVSQISADSNEYSSQESLDSVVSENTRDKENVDQNVFNVRSKLSRMGKLYSGDSSRELSSPIHRTEEKFSAEDNSFHYEKKNAKRGARLDRFAALASEINNWEDDLSHPTLAPAKKEESKVEKIHAKINQQVKAGLLESQPSTSGCGRWKSNSDSKQTSNNSMRQFKWDTTILDTLDKDSSKDKSPRGKEEIKEAPITSKIIQTPGLLTKSPEKTTSCKTGQSRTPEILGKNSSIQGNRHKIGGYNGPPKNAVQSPGSVLSKASLFETKSTTAKTKDPAEMTLSERMAFFEKNKGEALIPKAPLSLSVPTKKLIEQRDKSPALSISDHQLMRNGGGKSVSSNRALFEQGFAKQELENDILRESQTERHKELEMLRSRFNKNKEVVQAAAGFGIRQRKNSESTATSPKNSPICPVKPTPAMEHVPPAPPLPSSPKTSHKPIQIRNSPNKRQVAKTPPQSSNFSQQNREMNFLDVKRQKVSTSKLHPDLAELESSEIETEDTEYTVGTTEAETATCDETDYDIYPEESNIDDMQNSSLENSILREVITRQSINKKRTIESSDADSSTSEISVLDEMNEYLEGCLTNQDIDQTIIGPTPPKINRGSEDSPSISSKSFKYSYGSPQRSPLVVTPKSNDSQIGDCTNHVPLLHSVSFYRRQQSQTLKTPVKSISKTVNISSDYDYSSGIDEKQEEVLVQEKIKNLKEEVNKQQTIIGQSSQAVNFCTATVEFSGSREQVEGERTLLIATHRRQAALNEIQRLKVEGTIRPSVPGASGVQESGSLTISAITLPLKREHSRNINEDMCVHFLCLVRHLDTVIATPVVQTETGDSCVRFPSTLKLDNLYSDFKITIEVYSLETRAEILPHEVKYHIYNGGHINGSSGSKKGGSKTPKKYLKQENRLIMPSVQSPAGPSAVRTSSFVLNGYVIFSLKEINRQQFTLNKVPKTSPLEARLQMHVSCELSVNVEHRGFLTMFEDVSGFGAWHRRWCLLKGDTLSYWKYPDDEKKKTPIGSLELQEVSTKTVGLVARDICARPNTFLLETVRPAQSNDVESLKVGRHGSLTTIRNLLSADTKEDRLEWCSKLNKTLNLLRAWGRNSS